MKTKSAKLADESVQHSHPSSTSLQAVQNPSKTWTNPRKRPHNHDLKSLFESISNDDSLRESEGGQGLHASKRGRTEEWPLTNHDEPAVGRNASDQFERGDKRSSSTSMRPSRFIEGSMNDRISKEPPSLYTREEQAMEQYTKNPGQDLDEMDITYDANIEVEKPSGVFRFGKAIANAFKPFSQWQGMWKEKEKERSASPEKNVLQERQAKALQAYAELKKSGYTGTQKVPTGRQSLDTPTVRYEDTQSHQTSFRDSGIDMDEQRASIDQKDKEPFTSITQALLSPPHPRSGAFSPFSETSSRRKSSLQLRKPSFQSLKKVKSQIHLSPGKRNTDTPPIPPIDPQLWSPSNTLSPPPSQGLRREPSKKDIARQYRLTKKVSDLENKLETARRELNLSIATAPPVPDLPNHVQRSPFRPGALPSLPSEGNLSPQKDVNPPPVPKVDIETSTEHHIKSFARRSTRLAHHASPSRNASVDHHDMPASKNEAEHTNAQQFRKSSETRALMPTTANITKRLPNLPTKTPTNTPTKPSEIIPPLPTNPVALDSNKENDPTPALPKIFVDQPFHTHSTRPPSPFLGPPARTRSTKRSNRGISPPPPSLSSANKRATALDAQELTMEGVEFTDKIGELMNVRKPERKKREGMKRVVGGVGEVGNVVGEREEGFDWDEDVF